MGNTVIGRLNKIVRYVGPDKMTEVVNALFAQIPDEIGFGDFTLEGGISESAKILKDQYMQIPLDMSLQYTGFELKDPNLANFKDVVGPSDY
jgi:hypothetical protein